MENIFCLESHIHLCSRHTSAIPAYVIKTCLTWHAISGARYWGFVSPKLHVSTYRNQQHCWWFHDDNNNNDDDDDNRNNNNNDNDYNHNNDTNNDNNENDNDKNSSDSMPVTV